MSDSAEPSGETFDAQLQSSEAGPPALSAGEAQAGENKPSAAPGTPMLLRLRSGKTAALVIALGFGGGLTALGVGSAALSPMPELSMFSALKGYLLATSPLFLLAAIVALCRSELWLDPKARAFRLFTFRPWRLRPLIEEASVSEYAGVRTDPAPESEGGGTLVSLVTTEGEVVPIRQFPQRGDALPFAEQVAGSVGLWLRHGTAESEKS